MCGAHKRAMDTSAPHRPASDRQASGRRFVKILLAFGILGGVATLAVQIFQLGVLTGLATACGLLVVYSVPATLFDWPRLSLSDIIAGIGALLVAIFEAICAAVLSIFD